MIKLGFLGHVVEFWPILAEAKKIGMPVSKKGIDSLKARLEEEKAKLNLELQELVPDELKSRTPRRKNKETGEIEFGFVRPPEKEIERLWNEYRNSVHRSNDISFVRYCNSNGYGCIYLTSNTGCFWCRWYRVAPFKPSSKQVIAYIKWKASELAKSENSLDRRLAKKYKVPLLIDKKKGIKRETTGNKHLKELLESTGDEVILRIIGNSELKNASLGEKAGIRSIDKVIKNDIVNWQPASDGAVHTTWGLTAASGQLDSRSPNILNASKHTIIGKIFRRVIEAPGENIIVECDKKSYHVATMGYCANDESYIRFSQLDPHSYFTAYVADGEFGLPDFGMPDSEILSICKKYKTHEKWSWVRQHVSKVIVLGNQLGLGPTKAFLQNRKSFKNIEEVRKLQQIIAGIFPKIEFFKQAIKKQAHSQKKLVNEWGYQQHFWEVFSYKYDKEMNNWSRVPGTEAEKAIAFPVQSLAFGDIRDKLIQIKEKGLLERYKFISSIHDSFVFMFPRRLLDSFMVEVYPILVSPSRKLVKECCPKGLVVGVEIFWGKNFASMSVDNPNGMRELKI